jgi:hypothetical protein
MTDTAADVEEGTAETEAIAVTEVTAATGETAGTEEIVVTEVIVEVIGVIAVATVKNIVTVEIPIPASPLKWVASRTVPMLMKSSTGSFRRLVASESRS